MTDIGDRVGEGLRDLRYFQDYIVDLPIGPENSDALVDQNLCWAYTERSEQYFLTRRCV